MSEIMKRIHLPLSFLFSLIAGVAFSQRTEKFVEVIQPQEIYVNSASSFSGSSRKVISFQLPEKTIRWYYSFAAYRNEQANKNKSDKYNLLGKLSYAVDKTGATASLISVIGNPPGTDYCDVYLLSSNYDVQVFESKGDYSGKTYSYSRQGSRKNYISGVVDISDSQYISGWQHIGLKNPDLNDGVIVDLQVVAVVYDEPTTNGWTPSIRQKAYEAVNLRLKGVFAGQLKEVEINKLSACIVSQFTQKLSPQQFAGYAEFELNTIFSELGEYCSSDLKIDLTNVIPAQATLNEEYIFGKWQDQNSTFTISKGGNYSIVWDNGSFKFGKWKLEGSKLSFILDFGNRTDEYTILQLSDTELKYIGTGSDKTVWLAKKVGR